MSSYNQDRKAKLEVILLGYSGHGYVVLEAALLNGVEILGYGEKMEVSNDPFSLKYLGDESLESFKYWASPKNYILGIGDNNTRTKVAQRVLEHGGNCMTVTHPDSSISKMSSIGLGTFIARNVSVNPLVHIGNFVILNTSCSIDHECKIEDGAHIGPGAVLAGQVHVGPKAFIGANSVVKEGVSIGANAIIGAGSVVIMDVRENEKVVGNPARIING